MESLQYEVKLSGTWSTTSDLIDDSETAMLDVVGRWIGWAFIALVV